MARYRGPKNRIARRFAANVFGRKRNPMLHKLHPPGVHGARRRKKSDYGLQLNEKQKLKAAYGMISEKQLVRYYKEALRRPGNTMEHLMSLLEGRLDIVVYRLRLAPTIFAAHQLVAHGHIEVNGKKVDIRSFQVKPGMTVSVREKSRKIPTVVEAIETGTLEVPAYYNWDPKAFSGQLLEVPTSEQISLPLEVNVSEVCDFLAHTT